MIFKFSPKLSLKLATLALALGLTLGVAAPREAQAQSEPYIGQLMLFGGNFCPRGWAHADGQLLAISSHQALFSILGTIYGGDGEATFGLPDLRGRVPLGEGTGPGLANINIGQKGGRTDVTLTTDEMPSHNHNVQANNGLNGFADRKGPGNDFLGSPSVNDPNNPAEDVYIYSDQDPNQIMDPRMITHTGGGRSFNIRTPYLGMTWCVALLGIFPSPS